MSDKWNPDWVISPGETLRDWMEENGFVSGKRLLVKPVATACGRMPVERLERILSGKQRITTVDAAKLAAGTGISPRLWLNLERAFRQGLAEGKKWVK